MTANNPPIKKSSNNRSPARKASSKTTIVSHFSPRTLISGWWWWWGYIIFSCSSMSSFRVGFLYRHLALIKDNRWKSLQTSDTSVPGSKSEPRTGSGVGFLFTTLQLTRFTRRIKEAMIVRIKHLHTANLSR